jgi:hypothetical protein
MPGCTWRHSTEEPGVPDNDDLMPAQPRSRSVEAAQAAARRVLTDYRDGVVSLESLISWAETLDSSTPSDPWLRRTAQSLADPLLCHERAMAFVRDLLGE